MGKQIWRVLLVLALAPLAGGCAAFSATSLRCGTDGEDSSYVELLNLPQDISGQIRNYAQLCGFVYDTAGGTAYVPEKNSDETIQAYVLANRFEDSLEKR